jgi:hypothetical protein
LTRILHASSNGIPRAVRELRGSELVSGIGDSVAHRPNPIGNTEPGGHRLYKQWVGGRETVTDLGVEISTLQERTTVESQYLPQRKLASDSFDD